MSLRVLEGDDELITLFHGWLRFKPGARVTAETGAIIEGLVQSAGTGTYKIARAETALDGANPTPVATGLSSIVAAMVTLKGNVAPGLGTSVLTYDISGGTLNVYAWMPTSATNPTLIASTGTQTFSWLVIGN